MCAEEAESYRITLDHKKKRKPEKIMLYHFHFQRKIGGTITDGNLIIKEKINYP